ncbi:MAG: MarR family transcriptional regulator [Chloroflexota bacterium]|nr:MarR family transcriptional regulator [Chloroflexota bacterium]
MMIDVVPDQAEPTREPSDAPFVIAESLGYLANYLAKAFARALAEAMAPHGISVAQWAVLLFLWDQDGPSQTELSRRVAIETATMVRTIDRMERDGLVRRQRDTKDRRLIHVCLTDQGRALRHVLVPLAVAVNERATSGLTAIERDQARSLMHAMSAALTAAPVAPNHKER